MIEVARSIEEARRAATQARGRGLVVGLVPTMGALHAGHVSLIRAARAETGFVAVSIFVNPTQFGPNEDYTRYPRPIDQDLNICTAERVDLVLAPDAESIYPAGFQTLVEVQRIQETLEGASRPGHFRGVATVVLKLLNIVQPQVAFFGQKDAQQSRLIQQMVCDLNVPVTLRICPIVRETDGLALSSRNQYLTPEQRRNATVLYRALRAAQQLVAERERSARVLEELVQDRIRSTPEAILDYVAVVQSDTYVPIQHIDGDVLIALAVRFGQTRLIDNILVSANG